MSTYKSSLSAPRQLLIELLQRLNFGRVERLAVRGGEPVLDPAPTIVRTYKFTGQNGPRPEASRSDFVLRAPHLELLRLLDEVGDGAIAVLTVSNGLPSHAEVPG